ncbi:MAG: TfoX/Sxy family protein [Reichenbachiella sp.]
MGNKGDKMSSDSTLTAQLMVEKLSSINGITSKKMFGGHGIFCNGKMFGIVDSKGQVFLKANESNRLIFEAAGSHAHGKMPYLSIPHEIFQNQSELEKWAHSSIEI